MVANPTLLFPEHAKRAGHALHDAPAASQKLLSVENVSLEYRTRERIVRATHDVSFDVYGGDRFVLLGPSGCGKSTLLKAVGGFIEPTSGTISLDAQPVRGPGPDRIVVFQEFECYVFGRNAAIGDKVVQFVGQLRAIQQGAHRFMASTG